MKKLILLSICLFLTIPCQARIIYVDANAPGANTGSSWADAYNYLQHALSAASSGDEIRVAHGIYKPDQGVGITPGERTATFHLINGVAIKGGYAGFGEPDPNARDPNTYETILSGDLNGNDIDIVNPEDLPEQPSRAENSYHVVTGSGTNATAVMDGFTITAGNANQDHPSPHRDGGGMCNYEGSPMVTNCTFSENSAAGCGGGMFNFWESSPTLTNCTFSGNSGEVGGGMDNFISSPTLINCTFNGNSAWYSGGMDNWQSSPTLTNCTFSENSAYYYGGGMSNYEYSSPTVSDCTFSENSARYDGGGIYNRGSSPTVSNCTFSGNLASEDGGGMYNEGSSPTLIHCTFSDNKAVWGGGMENYYSSPTLTNCTFSDNLALFGGGMLNDESSPTVTKCSFSGNSASDVEGGWPGSGGGMYNYYSSPSLTNCIFSGNSTYDGGGMHNNASSPMLTNCTFSRNSADRYGGAMFSYYRSPTLTNCILWGNSPQEVHSGTPVITYSDVQGGWPGEGNIDADPRFGVPGSWELIKGMVSYWRFDGNADDTAGDNDGTVYGNPVWTIGQLGGALNLDGAGDYVDCGNDSSLNPTNNFSISAWFNLNGGVTAQIVCKGNVPAYFSGGAYTIRCIPSNGILVFYVRDSSNTNFGYTITEVSLNEWTHVVGTFSDGNISIYKNGDFVANGVLGTSTINTNNGPLGIGAEGDGGMPFNGTIDEVAIHNRALTGEEIQQLYQIGLAGHSYYHLLPDSPCINAGDPNYVPEPNETDLDGKPRVLGSRIEMGVYEFNHIPVADAGPDQTAYAWIDGIAQVTLDGTNSYDEDGQPLTYHWNWIIDGNSLTATEPNVTIELPVGEHIIELIVNDGIDDSEPNQVVITVVPPLESQLWVFPQIINRYGRQPKIFALLRLPEGITRNQVDSDEPLLLYPGGIEAIGQYVIQHRRRRAQHVSIFAFFDKRELMAALPDNDSVELEVVGRLKTGRYFYGTDTVRIIRRQRRPTGGSGDNRRVTVPLNR